MNPFSVDNLLYYGLVYLVGVACGILLAFGKKKPTPAEPPAPLEETLSNKLARGAAEYASNTDSHSSY